MEPLTLRRIRARPVLLELERPIVARIATITEWPLILIDLETEEGVTGRSYLEPYVPRAMRYLVPMLHDLGELLAGRPVAPVELFDAARRSLHFVGYGGLAMIAASGLDMAAWDALARAAGVPLCVLLGGSVGAVPAYNSNGLWLKEPDRRGGGGPGAARRGRLRRAQAPARAGPAGGRSGDGGGGARGRRRGYGADGRLQPGPEPGRGAARAATRSTGSGSPGSRSRWSTTISTAMRGSPPTSRRRSQIGENFYGPRDLHRALQRRACDLVMPDFMRIGGVTGWLRAAPIAAAAGIPISTHLYPEVAAHVLRVAETAHWLEWQDWADPILQEPYPVRDGRVHDPRPAGRRDRVGRGGGRGPSGRVNAAIGRRHRAQSQLPTGALDPIVAG